MNSEDETLAVEDRQCPYCSSQDACEHLLLVVDRTFRVADGGLLMDAFRKQWDRLFEDDAEDIDEQECFDDLLDSVDSLSDYAHEFEEDGGPGMSSDYTIYYVASREKAQRALAVFAQVGDTSSECGHLGSADSGSTG